MKIAVVTDSTACLPTGVQESCDRLYVVPLGVTIEGNNFTEDAVLDPHLISEAQGHGLKVTTSRPSPEVFREVYRRALADGAQAIVSVHAARTLSSTLESAQEAAASMEGECDDERGVEIVVVDSRSIGMGLGFGALAALSASKLKDAVEVAKQVSATADTTIYVDTLRHLHAGGRIGRARALLGSTFSIKPLLTVVDGVVVPVERARTSSKALELLVHRTAEQVERHRNSLAEELSSGDLASLDRAVVPQGNQTSDLSTAVPSDLGAVTIAVHASWPNEAAEKVLAQCSEIVGFNPKNVWRVPLGGSVAAHIGAGAIATVVALLPACEGLGTTKD